MRIAEVLRLHVSFLPLVPMAAYFPAERGASPNGTFSGTQSHEVSRTLRSPSPIGLAYGGALILAQVARGFSFPRIPCSHRFAVSLFGVVFIGTYLLVDVRRFEGAYLSSAPHGYRRDGAALRYRTGESTGKPSSRKKGGGSCR